MPVPGLSLHGLKRIRGFVSILRYINPTIIIITIIIIIIIIPGLGYISETVRGVGGWLGGVGVLRHVTLIWPLTLL